MECLYFGEKTEFYNKIYNLISQNNECLKDYPYHNMEDNYKAIFVIQLDALGSNIEFDNWILKLYSISNSYFENSIISFIIKSDSMLYTKKYASKIVFLLNQMGARVLGHGVLEFINNYENLKKWELSLNLSRDKVIETMVSKLIKQTLDYKNIPVKNPKILVLHASSTQTSNTLHLWQMVREYINYDNIIEFHVEEGTVKDCFGCSFDTCTYYSKDKSCFYGGVITEELLPLIEHSDVIIWICPNYNDSISAKLMAVINRLTVLYKRISFREKKIYSIIVSANSGSDSVASQLIDALTINKGFQLPPYFMLTELASKKGSIYKVDDIQKKARAFAELIKTEFITTKV